MFAIRIVQPLYNLYFGFLYLEVSLGIAFYSCLLEYMERKSGNPTYLYVTKYVAFCNSLAVKFDEPSQIITMLSTILSILILSSPHGLILRSSKALRSGLCPGFVNYCCEVPLMTLFLFYLMMTNLTAQELCPLPY
mmetsp:Transcript_26401/g.36293  ORF Transcript_26401/g.36293 Transcript_26401/m.36293 type:complete len:136 (-) Transcript_26401:710-1117(-)